MELVAVGVVGVVVLMPIIGWMVWRWLATPEQKYHAPDHQFDGLSVPSDIKFPKGVTITCPKCGDRVATAKRDVFEFCERDSSDFEWHQKFRGDFLCDSCLASYEDSYYGAVHTDKGWV